jgi:hypothetical protein
MLNRNQLFPLILLCLPPSVALGEAAQCPANSVTVHYHSLDGSQMAISVSINHSGPYDFMVDTGAQITVMDSDIAADLNLPSQGSISVVSFVNDASAGLVKPELVETGPVAVHNLPVVVEALDQIHALNPKVRGILGENFLGRFDLLIDYGHRIICFDESRSMQEQMQGERIPVLQRQGLTGDLAYTLPLQITVHLSGDGKRGTVLRVDSGGQVPILFDKRLAPLWWLGCNHEQQGNVLTKEGGVLVFGAIPDQNVRIGSRTTRQITFMAPICTSGRRIPRAGEDGLLPTRLFKKVFISYTDHFVMFDPH